MQDDTGGTEERSSTATSLPVQLDESLPPGTAELRQGGETVAQISGFDAATMPSHASIESQEEQGEEAQGDTRFGGLGPAEAARRRWELVRARKAASDDDDPDVATEVRWVRVPVRTGEIIRKLNADARKGSVQAAKELRAWLSEVARDELNAVSDLDRRTRQTLLDRLLADIEDEAERQAEGATPATAGTPIGWGGGAPPAREQAETRLPAQDAPALSP